MAFSTVNSREKGARGERELASILRARGYDAHRGLQYKGGPDSPDVLGLPGVHIEVKRAERLAIYDALSQAEKDAGAGEIPAVFHRRNRKKWVAILPMDAFLNIYEKGFFLNQNERSDNKP